MEYRVDIDAANDAKKSLSRIIDGKDNRLINKVGAFASLFRIDFSRYTDPILVLKTEEPGSKQVLSFKNDRVESICFDMINHLINDCICMGAEPLAVQDLIICSTMDPGIVMRIVKGCAQACEEQGCVLTGGETTQQPDVVPDNTFILGSSIVGIVENDSLIDGSGIRENDVVISIAANGLHTNGYTLVRDLLSRNKDLAGYKCNGESFLDTILKPHKCYYNSLKGLFGKNIINGLAHITGGGIKENLDRILPDNLDAEIDLGAYQINDVFKIIKEEADITDEKMLRTFNMGVGMAVVASEEQATTIIEHLTENGENASVIGKIVTGSGNVKLKNSFRYK